MYSENSEKVKNYLNILRKVIFALLVIFFLYQVVYSIYYSQTTGILQASSPGAVLTVTKPGYSFNNVGTGTARVRLKPGSYELIISKGQQQTTRNFQIYKKATTAINVSSIPSSQVVPSSYTAANSLIKYLPFVGPASEYRIDFIYTFNNTVATPVITIYATDSRAQQDALNWISAMGYNPSTLNIRYLANTPNHSAQNNDAL